MIGRGVVCNMCDDALVFRAVCCFTAVQPYDGILFVCSRYAVRLLLRGECNVWLRASLGNKMIVVGGEDKIRVRDNHSTSWHSSFCVWLYLLHTVTPVASHGSTWDPAALFRGIYTAPLIMSIGV